MTKCDECINQAEPEVLPEEKQPNGFDPSKENLCGECYSDKYYVKGEDY